MVIKNVSWHVTENKTNYSQTLATSDHLIIEYFGTKLGRRDYVGKIYKRSKFGADRLRNGAATWWWNITVLRLSSPTFYRPRNDERFSRPE